MVEKNRVIKVTNRDKGSVGYFIPDLNNLTRQFQSGETKEITFEEIERLSWIPGGDYILENCLVIHDEEAAKSLLPNIEPEYYYKKEDIVKLMEHGSLDEFLDCLDFAPEGVLSMIKDLAVSLPLNDVQKRNAIEDKLGFNVTNAILLTEEDNNEEEEDKHTRRVAEKEKNEGKSRRTSGYNVTHRE